MTIVVTGATGFLGRALVDRLLADSHHVKAPVRGHAHDLPAACDAAPVGALEALDESGWRDLLAGADAIVHAAAIAHIGPDVPRERYMAVNRDASVRLAEAAASLGIRRFVFLSSIRAQVGPSSTMPQTEALPPHPTEAYGESKLQAERLILAACPTATILRPPLIVGHAPKGNLALLARLAGLALPLPVGGFTAPQAVVSRDNLVDAITHALDAEAMRGETYVIADEPHPSLADMLGWMREGMGRPRRLVGIPPALIGLPARLAGKGEAFGRLTGGLRVDAAKIRAAGYAPRQGVADAFRAIGAAASRG
jgi:nucleoside-diphosphate-sugar epimerase